MTTARGPLWQQVLSLERRIASGDIVDRFPTDRELTEHYGVSRHTAREAVRRLRTRGLVDRQRGRDSFLNDGRFTQPLGGLYSLFRTVEDRGLTQRSEVLALEPAHDADAATRLDLAPRAELARVERLRFANDQPLALDRVCFRDRQSDLRAWTVASQAGALPKPVDSVAGRCGPALTSQLLA